MARRTLIIAPDVLLNDAQADTVEMLRSIARENGSTVEVFHADTIDGERWAAPRGGEMYVQETASREWDCAVTTWTLHMDGSCTIH